MYLFVRYRMNIRNYLPRINSISLKKEFNDKCKEKLLRYGLKEASLCRITSKPDYIISDLGVRFEDEPNADVSKHSMIRSPNKPATTVDGLSINEEERLKRLVKNSIQFRNEATQRVIKKQRIATIMSDSVSKNAKEEIDIFTFTKLQQQEASLLRKNKKKHVKIVSLGPLSRNLNSPTRSESKNIRNKKEMQKEKNHLLDPESQFLLELTDIKLINNKNGSSYTKALSGRPGYSSVKFNSKGQNGILIPINIHIDGLRNSRRNKIRTIKKFIISRMKNGEENCIRGKSLNLGSSKTKDGISPELSRSLIGKSNHKTMARSVSRTNSLKRPNVVSRSINISNLQKLMKMKSPEKAILSLRREIPQSPLKIRQDPLLSMIGKN